MPFIEIMGRLVNTDQVEVIGPLADGQNSLIRYASGRTSDIIGVTVDEIADAISHAETALTVVRTAE